MQAIKTIVLAGVLTTVALLLAGCGHYGHGGAGQYGRGHGHRWGAEFRGDVSPEAGWPLRHGSLALEQGGRHVL